MPMNTNAFRSYADVREDTRELLRQNLVEAASHILTSEGPDALTVRRIAQVLESSTKVIYSLFGGKDGVANELYLEGCDRLRQSIEAVPPQADARDYVRACGWAYWEFARANPSYYAVMFDNAIPQFQPDKTSLETVGTAFKLLVQTLSDYQMRGLLPTDDIAETIRLFWAPLHGVLSLHHGHHFGEQEARVLYQRALDAVIDYLL